MKSFFCPRLTYNNIQMQFKFQFDNRIYENIHENVIIHIYIIVSHN